MTILPRHRRRGSILPLVALLIVALCGFTAISVEIATITTVKVQCQNAADAAALAAARTLDGGATSRTSQAISNGIAVATANSALGKSGSGKVTMLPFAAAEVALTVGTYHYNTTGQSFSPAYALASGENYNLVKATAQRVVYNGFFAVNGGSGSATANPTIVATAVAAHRPRDIALVFDFSGSMNDESDLWNADTYFGSYFGQSNNSDPVVPAFGHYSSPSTALVSTATAPGGQCNLTQAVQGTPAMVDSYFSSARGAGGVAAFTAQPASYGTQPMGDVPVNLNNAGSGSYAQTLNQIFGTTSTTSFAKNSAADYFENASTPLGVPTGSQGSGDNAAAGYDRLYTLKVPPVPSGLNKSSLPGFAGFTVGPGYWGKTFFQWPPDPRPTRDWRQLYFKDSSNKGISDNTVLWDPNAQTWNAPGNYQINYKAILSWIKNAGPNPFPATLRAGRIVYYTSIPADVPAAAYDYTQPNSNITDPSQRFWKEYIDYTLGVWTDPLYRMTWKPGSTACSYGPDYAWGNVQISGKPSGSAGSNRLAYMNYNDNPPRPRHRMWFGPMTMLQFISDTGISSGTVRDISTYSAKLGIASILQDVQINHPNDSVALIFYNRPQYSGEPAIGKFSQALYSLNRDYPSMTNSLWYPPNSGTVNVAPYDVNGSQAPSADNDFIYNTATNHGLMLAYNQFSGASALSSAGVGGLGRVGAKRLVVLETDGMANVNTNAGFSNNTTNSYYNILPSQGITAGNYDQNATLQVAQAICNTATGVAGTPNSMVANPGFPGFATSNKPVTIHTIAFGVVFEIATSTQTSAVNLLQRISAIGGTSFPSSPSDPTDGYKWCTGGLTTRAQKLQQAFSKALDDGNSISLVQ